MKKLLLTVGILVQTALVMAQVPTTVKSDNVNLYRQPGIGAEVIRMVNTTEEVNVVRKFDANWSIVTVAGQTGYIHNTNLRKVKKASVSAMAAQ